MDFVMSSLPPWLRPQVYTSFSSLWLSKNILIENGVQELHLNDAMNGRGLECMCQCFTELGPTFGD